MIVVIIKFIDNISPLSSFFIDKCHKV